MRTATTASTLGRHSLSYQRHLHQADNDTLVSIAEETAQTYLPQQAAWNNTIAAQQIQELEQVSASSAVVAIDSTSLLQTKRCRLKRELARVSITGFHPDAAVSTPSVEQVKEPRTAECIMKELEQMNPLPILRPAMHHSLNAHWSFVFTGVPTIGMFNCGIEKRNIQCPSVQYPFINYHSPQLPTIGMQLITLLSRITVLLPFEVLDFRDVALCVTDDQSQAKAVVEVKVCGAWEVLLEVCTSLRRPTDEDLENEFKDFQGEEGTLLLEHFEGVHLNGMLIVFGDFINCT